MTGRKERGVMTQQTRYYVRRFYENQILINKINDITILLIISVPFERRLQRSGELRTALIKAF